MRVLVRALMKVAGPAEAEAEQCSGRLFTLRVLAVITGRPVRKCHALQHLASLHASTVYDRNVARRISTWLYVDCAHAGTPLPIYLCTGTHLRTYLALLSFRLASTPGGEHKRRITGTCCRTPSAPPTPRCPHAAPPGAHTRQSAGQCCTARVLPSTRAMGCFDV